MFKRNRNVSERCQKILWIVLPLDARLELQKLQYLVFFFNRKLLKNVFLVLGNLKTLFQSQTQKWTYSKSMR